MLMRLLALRPARRIAAASMAVAVALGGADPSLAQTSYRMLVWTIGSTSLALILLVVGVKMLLAEWLHLALGDRFNLYLLSLIILILIVGVIASVLADGRQKNSAKGG